MSRNYQLVYYVAQKCVNYRDTGVSKNPRYFVHITGIEPGFHIGIHAVKIYSEFDAAKGFFHKSDFQKTTKILL